MKGMRLYPSPQICVYHHDTNKFGRQGWIMSEEKVTVIGENDEILITRLIPHRCCDSYKWEEYGKTKVIAIGVHKSRFVRWESNQLQLFN